VAKPTTAQIEALAMAIGDQAINLLADYRTRLHLEDPAKFGTRAAALKTNIDTFVRWTTEEAGA
jgi:hypothetical protein